MKTAILSSTCFFWLVFAWTPAAPAAPLSESYSESCTKDSQTWKRFLHVLEERFGEAGGRVSPESNLVDELAFDELGLVELVMAVEEEFGVDIPDEVVEKMNTAGDWCGYLTKHAQESLGTQ